MASSPTLKELSKAIANYLPTATLPLPDGLTKTIDAYIQRFFAKGDESAADRLQEDLLSLYQKHVQDEPALYAPFVKILRQLRPILMGEARVNQWWEKLIEPVLNEFLQDKALASEGFGILLDVLTDDTDLREPQGSSSTHNPLADRILGKWLSEFEKSQTEMPGTGSQKEKQLRKTLIQYGKKKPKEFMHAINGFVVKEDCRGRILTLLCEFVQKQPPHLHQVLHTPLFKNLLRILQQDTSTTIVNMAMTAIIMLLPHMPSSLVPHLPTLFNIYARLLFWEREVGCLVESAAQLGEKGDESASITSSVSWEKCTFSSELDDIKIPHLINYFTILYGLYPINFMDYIRKPQRYLRHANASNMDEIEVQPTEIRQKSEKFRQCHQLHPNFYSLTIDSEKTDFGRWIKSEPPEVLADCMALCHPSEADRCHSFEGFPMVGGSTPAAENDQDGAGRALLSGGSMFRDASPLDYHRDSWRLTQSSDSPVGNRAHSTLLRQSSQSSHPSTRDSLEMRGRDLGGDSPTLPPHLSMTSSQAQPPLQEMIASNKVIKSGLHQSLANDSVPSLALSHHESIPEKQHDPPAPASGSRVVGGSSIHSSDPHVRNSQLYHQVLLLNNDLNFERYLKQQHMAHIGELRRRQVKELATEAETQNLLNQNRLLKKGLEDAKKVERQVKKEADRGRALGKKWEADLQVKLKHLREEQKKWNSERRELKRELDTAKEERHILQKLVSEAEVRDLEARQDMKSNEMIMEEMDRLKKEIDRLLVGIRDHEAREAETKEALREASSAEGKVERLNMMVQALESELAQTKQAYKARIEALNTRLEKALDRTQTRQNASFNAMVESAVAASRAKQAELQKHNEALAKRNSMLQSRYLDLKSTINNSGRDGGRAGMGMPHGGADSDAETSAVMTGAGLSASRSVGSIPSGATRPHRGFSDPEASFEGIAYNVTPPLDALPSTPTGASGGLHGSTPPGDVGKMSPESQRHYGRGGVQNALRKDKKDKKGGLGGGPGGRDEDDSSKKSTGIRGIRRFV
ncbi:tuberous sclerosis 1 [Zalerion maritima]|uniref:Tuberous sclerosis 1 n=1 Tax=Zalerion maritima TaxID=339359 RepID=A0AAD5RU06_9PEZI|nr:tuberous sclerosis 1 [Zalerion maritima]